ncbi:NAD(P)H-dependent oxidoreductase [Streptomyces varsoviensis]|uniref:NAD(P)H-dependent oxidoreductase n=1 Tax=Streptomyces varsoviensis TaxID=67373 RepID=UPI003F4D3CF6
MKVLWLFAHPEQRSLNASLRDDGIRALEELGHETRLSDLYAMGWNPVVDRSDYRRAPVPTPAKPTAAPTPTSGSSSPGTASARTRPAS